MSKTTQLKKNLLLSKELANYIVDHPDIEMKFPDNSTFVFFIKNDFELNKINNRLVKSLLKEGKTVVKAEKIEKENDSWNFTPVSP